MYEQVFPEQLFSADLLPDERVLWTGRPDPRRIFSRADMGLIPFSLLWCGFAVFWELSALREILSSPTDRGMAILFLSIGSLFVAVGLYMLFGRFIVKSWVRKKTYYAVTNKRVLILRKTRDRYLGAACFDAIPMVNKSIRKDGIGTIAFGNASTQDSSGQDTAMSWGPGELAFYDIPDAQRVYELVERVRSGAPW